MYAQVHAGWWSLAQSETTQTLIPKIIRGVKWSFDHFETTTHRFQKSSVHEIKSRVSNLNPVSQTFGLNVWMVSEWSNDHDQHAPARNSSCIYFFYLFQNLHLLVFFISKMSLTGTCFFFTSIIMWVWSGKHFLHADTFEAKASYVKMFYLRIRLM